MSHRPSRTTVALFTHGAGDPNSRAIWSGAADAAAMRDANLVCFPGKPLRSPIGFEAQSNVLYDLVDPARFDGLVVWLAGLALIAETGEVREFLKRYGDLPIVTCGGALEGYPGVGVDNYHGMRDVVTHMIESHRSRRIAFVRGPAAHQEAEARYRAYRDALADHGVPFDEELVVQGNFKESGGISAVRTLVDDRRVRFDALVAASDNMAIGAMKALQVRRIRVPADVGVAGLNDESQSRFFTPPLTTGPLHFYEQAFRAMEMLVDMLEGRAAPAQIELPTRLLVRQSCGCPDPLVEEAASPPSVATRSSIWPAGLARGEITRELAQLADDNAHEEWEGPIDRIVDAFLIEVGGGRSGGFLSAFAEALRGAAARGEFLSSWQSVLSAMRRHLLSELPEAGVRDRAENLWQQARVMLGETAQRTQAHRGLLAQERARTLSEVSLALSASGDERELAAVLVESLPRLGVPACCLAMYVDLALPSGQARLVAAYDQRATAFQPGACFPAPQLLPRGIESGSGRFSLVVEPLHYRDDQLGFVVLAADPQDEETYELLRGQIAGALQRSLLAARNVELYNDAVRARQAAELADSLKSRFLATVSHELRTPLSLITGTIEMMQRKEAGADVSLPARYRSDLNAIRASAQHLSHLIGDVLDLASSQAGELRLVNEAVNLDTLLREVSHLAEPLAREKGLSWTLDLPAALPQVWGDRTRLRQVVLNLVSNAVKFTERGGVTLAGRCDGPMVTVSVSDTGVGVVPEDFNTIFDEFRQSERTILRGYGGMGLGLAIVRRLVELHGGSISVRSAGPEGTGSTFSFTLPALGASARAPERDRSHTVLLVAEKPDPTGELAGHLSAQGFAIEEMAVSLHPCWLEEIVASPPGAVVLAFEPAAERGWEIMRALQANAATQDVPVIFYSWAEGRAAGDVLQVEFLLKPLAPAALGAAIGGHLPDAPFRRILIVDDDEQILALHTRMVRTQYPDCQIQTARDGRTACEIALATPPDLILLDLMMPEMDGFGVLARLREHAATRFVPVVVLSAQSLSVADMAQLQDGVAAVLGKGLFSPQEVLDQVTAALQHSKRLGSEALRTVRRAMGFIHQHYAGPLVRSDLARHAGVSERYLTRVFHEETGVTPITYLTRYRVRQAQALLEQGHLNVTQVALAVGFSDSGYFARVFQKETGVSPAAYRRGERRSTPSI